MRGQHTTIWRLESTPEDTVANSRACLALLRMWRSMPQTWGLDDQQDRARQLWPVVRLEAVTLRRCLKAWAAARGGQWRTRRPLHKDVDRLEWLGRLLACKELPEYPAEVEVLDAIGEALDNRDPSFIPLFDRLEARLTVAARRKARFDRNAKLLAQVLNLSAIELSILQLAAAFDSATIDVTTLTSVHKPVRRVQAIRVAIAADSEHDIQAALAPSSALMRSGLMSSQTVSDLEDQLRLTRQGSELLANPRCSLEAMAALVLKPLPNPAPPVTLEWPHLQSRRALLDAALRGALENKEHGINIFLYGAPGTCKTEFARSMISELQAAGFAVEDNTVKNMSATREERLASLRLSQVFAPQGHSILVLDEAEDIFQEDYFRHPLADSTRVEGKAWMNSQLESNRIPVIWISNRIDHIDPAYLRRFTYCLEFPTTPREVRRKIARSYLAPVGGSDALIESVAQDPNLAPALVASAARFVRLSAAEGAAADLAAQQMLADHLKAQGKLTPPQLPERATRFDFTYLNVEGNIAPAAVTAALQRTGTGSVLMIGPPGTGKTQLAAEVAKVLGRELTYRTASDINSMWYGQSERNVAALFEDCEPQAQVLFVDEADTLLGARDAGSHRADRAVTSEFLRRLEAFRGVFLCATNHARELDPALMRRFIFRLSFLPLTAAQKAQLLAETALGWSPAEAAPQPQLGSHLSLRLNRLDQLTPGDFANVAKRFRALGERPTLEQWICELEAEHAANPRGRQATIGFV